MALPITCLLPGARRRSQLNELPFHAWSSGYWVRKSSAIFLRASKLLIFYASCKIRLEFWCRRLSSFSETGCHKNLSNLFSMTSIALELLSIRMNSRPFLAAASPKVPLPAKKSRHKSPGLECIFTILSRIPSGFCVAYPVFSLPLVGTMVCHQTSVGVLPRAAFSGPTNPGAI